MPAAVKRRAKPASVFDDHFSQVTLFYRSLTPIEQSHVVGAYTFELGKCYEQAIKERALAVLADIDTQLCEDVAARLGLPAPVPAAPPSAPATSPALSQVGGRYPAAGRRIGIITDANSDVGEVAAAVAAITAAKLVPLVFAPHGGTVGHDGISVPIARTYFTGRSIEVDALLIAGSPSETNARILVDEAFRHLKAIAVLPAGADLLAAAGRFVRRGGRLCRVGRDGHRRVARGRARAAPGVGSGAHRLIASSTAAALAAHIDGPCGTVVTDQPIRATVPITTVSNGAPIAASNHTSAPKQPVSAPIPRASLTSPAPIAVGATRCTSR